MFNSQAGQDQFVINILNQKKDGYFLEIGSNHPININNTYLLEKTYNWKGLMIEYDRKYEKMYKDHRTSNYIIEDATKIDYVNEFKKLNFPQNMDYLQIDLEVDNGSTINTLEILNNTIFPEYKFATVTFEHDIYRGNYFNTKERSREIFENNGYIRVFGDISNDGYAFEDWYVYPDLVNMDLVDEIKKIGPIDYKQAIQLISQ
jgi:hypothetical protein